MVFRKGIYQGFGFKKGNVPWNKDKKLDKEKYPNVGFFRKHSEESIKKMSDSHKGFRPSEDHRKKVSISLKKAYNEKRRLPLKLSEESETLRRKKISETMKGKKKSIEMRHKLSETRKNLFVEGKLFISDSQKRIIRDSRLHQVFPSKDSSIEVKVQEELTRLGIDYEKHKALMGQPDIFIEPDICIFLDGCYWHGCERCLDRNEHDSWIKGKKVKDLLITQKLQNDGYVVLRFWEHEINENIEFIALKIKNVLDGVKIGIRR